MRKKTHDKQFCYTQSEKVDAEVQTLSQDQLAQTLIKSAFIENTLIFLDPEVGGIRTPLGPPV